MEHIEECKGCSVSVVVSEEDLDALVREAQIKDEDRVDKSVYEQRLVNCQSCPSLIYGTTCKHCGCLVRYKALFKYKTCAHPNGAKW